MFSIFLFALLNLFFLPEEEVYTATFDVMHGNTVVGELVVEKRKVGDQVTYTTLSKSSFNFLGKHTIMHSVEATYRDGFLYSSEMSSVKDGKPRNETSIVWRGGHYEITEDGNTRQHSGRVDMTSVMLYFTQPPLQKKVMSERDGSWRVVEAGPSPDVLTLTSGKRNDSQDYTYNDGEVQHVEVRNTLFTIEIRRQ